MRGRRPPGGGRPRPSGGRGPAARPATMGPRDRPRSRPPCRRRARRARPSWGRRRGVEGLGAGEARQVTGLPGGGDHAGLGRVEHEDVVEVARGEAPLERRGVEVALDVVVGEKHLGVLIHEGVGGGGHDRVVEVGPRAPEHREGHGLPCLGPGGVGDEGLGVPRAADGRRRCQGEAHGAQERPPRTRHGTPSRLLTPYFRFHVKSSPIIAARGRIVATSSAVINGSTRRRPTVRD